MSIGDIGYAHHDSVHDSLYNTGDLNMSVYGLEYTKDESHLVSSVSERDEVYLSGWLNYIYRITDTIPEGKYIITFPLEDGMLLHYTYCNRKYTINLDTLCKLIDKGEKCPREYIAVGPRRGIIYAHIVSRLDFESTDITRDMKKSMGVNSDFYKGVTGCQPDIKDILYYLDLDFWDKVIISDTFGGITTLDLNDGTTLSWTPGLFSL